MGPDPEKHIGSTPLTISEHSLTTVFSCVLVLGAKQQSVRADRHTEQSELLL